MLADIPQLELANARLKPLARKGNAGEEREKKGGANASYFFL
jgi:hypothetical protein